MDRSVTSIAVCRQKVVVDIALIGIRSALSHHSTSPLYHLQINIIHDRAFMLSNHVFTGMMKKPVGEGDIEKLYSSGMFYTDNPVILHYKVFWDMMFISRQA